MFDFITSDVSGCPVAKEKKKIENVHDDEQNNKQKNKTNKYIALNR